MIAPGWWSDASSGGRHFPQHEAVSVPYWEWEGGKGAGERELYLRGKLEALGGGVRRDFNSHTAPPLGRSLSDESSQCEREREEHLGGRLIAVPPF